MALEMPALFLFNGDWQAYLPKIYSQFQKDFVISRGSFRGRRLGLKAHPVYDGKEGTFWHFISEGSVESERVPDFRRCERIAWPRFLIDHCDDPEIFCWEQDRQGSKRIAISVSDFSYLVILDDRGTYLLPWTAYWLEREHQRRKLRKEWEEWNKKTEEENKKKAGAASVKQDDAVTPFTHGE